MILKISNTFAAMFFMNNKTQYIVLKIILFFIICTSTILETNAQSAEISSIKAQLNNTSNSDDRIKLNLEMSLLYYNHGDIRSALEYAKNAEQVIMPYTQNDLRGSVHLYEGNFLLELGKYGDALNHFQMSYESYAKDNNKLRMTVVLSSLCVVFERMNNPEMALEYGRKVVKNRIELNDSVGLAIAYTNLGNIYEDLEKYEMAFNYYMDATYIDSVFQNERDLSIDYNNLGYLFEQLNDLNKAMFYYSKSYEIDNRLEDIYNQGIVIGNMARVNLKLNKVDDANKLELNSLDFAILSGSIRNISDCYKLLSEIETSKNNPKNSFEYFKLYMAIEDSLNQQINLVSNENLNSTSKNIIKETHSNTRIGQGGINDILFYALAFILFATVVFLLIKLYKSN